MTVLDGSKKDVLNQNYKNVLTVQLVPLLDSEIAARVANDPNGTLYFDTTAQKFMGKLNGSLETIQSA